MGIKLQLYYVVFVKEAEYQYYAGPFGQWTDAYDYKRTDVNCKYEPYKYEIVCTEVDVVKS